MKKHQLYEILDEYDEKAAWAFLMGYWPSNNINELHKIYQQDLMNLNEEDEIPQSILDHIKHLAEHPDEEWAQPAKEIFEKIMKILNQEKK